MADIIGHNMLDGNQYSDGTTDASRNRDYANQKAAEAAMQQERDLASPPASLLAWAGFIGILFVVGLIVTLFVGNPQLLSWWGPWCWWVIGSVFGLVLLIKIAQGIGWMLRHPIKTILFVGFLIGSYTFILYLLGFFAKKSSTPAGLAPITQPAKSPKLSSRKPAAKPIKLRQVPPATPPVKARTAEPVRDEAERVVR